MHNGCIAIRLRLPGLVVLGSKEWPDCIEVVIQYSNEDGLCRR